MILEDMHYFKLFTSVSLVASAMFIDNALLLFIFGMEAVVLFH